MVYSKEKIFMGVCVKLGKHFNINVILLRSFFILSSIFSGLGFILYLLLILIMRDFPESYAVETMKVSERRISLIFIIPVMYISIILALINFIFLPSFFKIVTLLKITIPPFLEQASISAYIWVGIIMVSIMIEMLSKYKRNNLLFYILISIFETSVFSWTLFEIMWLIFKL